MIESPDPEESLHAYIREWAWPFDASDEDVAKEGSAYVRWTREDGFLDAQILVFRFDDAVLDLAPDAERPDRRLTLTADQVDALAAPLANYLEGRVGYETFAKSSPGAAAVLALYFEARSEASATLEDDMNDLDD